MVDIAYDGGDLYDFLPSYAHNNERAPLVKDPLETKNMFGSVMNSSMQIFAALFGTDLAGIKQIANEHAPESFNSTPKPHPHTSSIARFRSEHVPAAPAGASIAQAVLHGCCSLTSDSTYSPIRLHTVSNSDVLVFAGAGGWKNRDPMAAFFRLDTCPEWDGFPDSKEIKNGLLDICYDLALDPSRKLIYAADSDRIKSFAYKENRSYLPTHTLASKRSGPLSLVDNGSRILRAGKGGVDVWNVDSLPTHGPKGNKRIGKGKVSIEDTWRDEPEEDVERSTGTPRDASINFADVSLEVGSWHIPRHWSTGGSLKALCFPKKTWSTVLQLDLEDGGKIASRFIGHGGDVYSIQTSDVDQNTFMTTAGDGMVRLFDIREPLPKMSFDAGAQTEHTYAALYVHIEGIPVLFSGGVRSECIKVWDVRAPKLAYELATGNNEVVSLAWDAPRSTLYAATECGNMDRLGGHHDYRQAKIKYDEKEIRDCRGQTEGGAPSVGGAGRKADVDEDEDMDKDDEEDDEDEYDEEKCWPTRAYHDEHYFGYAFDSGDHCILRYKFGLEADCDIVPAFGNARCDNGDYW